MFLFVCGFHVLYSSCECVCVFVRACVFVCHVCVAVLCFCVLRSASVFVCAVLLGAVCILYPQMCADIGVAVFDARARVNGSNLTGSSRSTRRATRTTASGV